MVGEAWVSRRGGWLFTEDWSLDLVHSSNLYSSLLRCFETGRRLGNEVWKRERLIQVDLKSALRKLTLIKAGRSDL